MVICLELGADSLHYRQADATASQKPVISYPYLNPDWFYVFWYRLTQVVFLEVYHTLHTLVR